MDKIKGEVEAGEGGGFGWGRVEGWGEKADNCNWTTIKILKKSPWTPLRTWHKNKNKIAQEDKTTKNNNISKVLIVGYVEVEYLRENINQTTSQKQKLLMDMIGLVILREKNVE